MSIAISTSIDLFKLEVKRDVNVQHDKWSNKYIVTEPKPVHMTYPGQMSPTYDADFFDEYAYASQRSAEIVVPIVNDLVKPHSVLDVGCGLGTWLAEWIRVGVTDVIGLDGKYVDPNTLRIPTTNFMPTDLNTSFSLGRTFDLVESLEVAEHLDEDRADQLVEAIANHGDTVLFSAAIPGQGGQHHVNEQWPSYWVKKFSEHGLALFDVIRPTIWQNPEVEVWYRQNIFIFSSELKLDRSALPTNLVHPELWDANRLNSGHPTLRSLLADFPAATRASLQYHLKRLQKAMHPRAERDGDH
jgi:SAM-dependent methyltransferase